MERTTFQPASVSEATEGLTSIKNDFPTGNPFMQPPGSLTAVYLSVGIIACLTLTAIVVAVLAFMKRNK